MTTIALVGGTGFLGRHVAAALQKSGYRVRVLSRRTGYDGLHPDSEALQGVDAVVNLAGIKRESGGQTFEAVHVDLLKRLVDAMKTVGIRRLVHISVVVARPAPGLPYHDTKWKGEETVRASGLDWTILRPGVIYGEGDDMLAHLTRMIRAASVFPIVGDGSSPMRPVDARDVALAVVAALQKPSLGKTYDIVGPDRLTLREVVRCVSEAMDLPVSIWNTPVALMRLPVWIMEMTMRRPLSTRAQLAMLAEGLDGDPTRASHELGLVTAPFTAERLRPILAKTENTFPFGLRLISSGHTRQEVSSLTFWLLTVPTVLALTFVFLKVPDRWTGITSVMTAALLASALVRAVRSRVRPSRFQAGLGLLSGALLIALTHVAASLLHLIWPGWEVAARELYSWSVGHSPVFLATTLVLAVAGEELFWRGIVTRFLMQRWGGAAGIAAGALIYALAHLTAWNPLIVVAALVMGLYWGGLYAATDDLVAPFVCHLLWDIILFFVFPVVR